MSFSTDESTQSIVVVSVVMFLVGGNIASISLMTGDPNELLPLLESDIGPSCANSLLGRVAGGHWTQLLRRLDILKQNDSRYRQKAITAVERLAGIESLN